MMLLRSQIISYFNTNVLSGLPVWQPHRAVKSTAARNKHCKKLTRFKVAGLNPVQGQFFAMLISWSHCSDSHWSSVMLQ